MFWHFGRVRPTTGAGRQQLQRTQPRHASRRPRARIRSPTSPWAPSPPRVAQRGTPPAATPTAAAPVTDQQHDALPKTERGSASPPAAEHVLFVHPRTCVVNHGRPLPNYIKQSFLQRRRSKINFVFVLFFHVCIGCRYTFLTKALTLHLYIRQIIFKQYYFKPKLLLIELQF